MINGIEDLGYTLSAVCEAAEVDPSTITFTVNEETVIADSSVANLAAKASDYNSDKYTLD